jgi:predicted dehydrogenase
MTDQATVPTTQLKFASIGLGWWGDQLAKAVQRSGTARIASCYARSADARAKFASSHGCDAAGSFEQVLEDDSIDAVVLATPHSTHLMQIKAAAKAGKHVFVEKPMTVAYEEAIEAVHAARAAGVVLQVGHHRRRVAATRALRQRVDDGAFGLVHMIEAKITTPSDITPRGGWRGDPKECPLGGMTALGVHGIDTIQYLGGEITSVYAASRQILGRGRLDDATTLSLELASGALATLMTSMVVPRETSIAIHGHQGSGWSEMDGAEFYLQAIDAPGRERQDIEVTDAVADQMREFAESIASGKDPEVTGEVGADVIAILEAARISAAERRPVSVADVRDESLIFS